MSTIDSGHHRPLSRRKTHRRQKIRKVGQTGRIRLFDCLPDESDQSIHHFAGLNRFPCPPTVPVIPVPGTTRCTTPGTVHATDGPSSNRRGAAWKPGAFGRCGASRRSTGRCKAVHGVARDHRSGALRQFRPKVASLSRPRSSPFWLRHAIFLLHVVLHWLILPHGALASLRGRRVTTS